MSLEGKQIRCLFDAILSGYRSKVQLAMMVRMELGEKLSEIADGTNLSEVVFELIDWADRTGRVHDLIGAAHRGNLNNPQIRALISDFAIEEPSKLNNKKSTPHKNNTLNVADQISHNHLSREAQFWIWFEQHSEQLMNFEGIDTHILASVGEELSRVAQGLTFEFSSKGILGKEFIISADGDPRFFSDVIRLVGSAPVLSGWKFIAFRQPKNLRMVVTFGESQLSPDEILFLAVPNLNRLHLVLYVKNLKRKDLDFVTRAAFIVLDMAIGEYDVETQIGSVEFKEAPTIPSSLDLKPFHMLPNIVNNWKSGRR